jgi:hypothetical protein
MSENEKDPPLPVVSALCGNCLHWQHVEPQGIVAIGAPERGQCFGLPPTPQSVIENGRPVRTFNMRAQVAENERGCALFMPHPDATEIAAAAIAGSTLGKVAADGH